MTGGESSNAPLATRFGLLYAKLIDADPQAMLALGKHDISVALMLLTGRLSPLERTSFLLHYILGLGFAEVDLTRTSLAHICAHDWTEN